VRAASPRGSLLSCDCIRCYRERRGGLRSASCSSTIASSSRRRRSRRRSPAPAATRRPPARASSSNSATRATPSARGHWWSRCTSPASSSLPGPPRHRAGGQRENRQVPTAAGAHVRLDVPPTCWPLIGDPRVPLSLTEGCRKSDSLCGADRKLRCCRGMEESSLDQRSLTAVAKASASPRSRERDYEPG
jgi:hypothetical protein